MKSLRFFLFFTLFAVVLSHEILNPHLLPRPLILEYPEMGGFYSRKIEEETHLQCTGWRFAVEANSLVAWKSTPSECADYVRNYMTGRAYNVDLERVSREAVIFATSVELSDDGKDAWVFDVDDTLISNLPYYAKHAYEVYDGVEFDKGVEKAMAPAINASLSLYEELLSLGFKVFLLTGRHEKHRNVTIENLMNAGFRNWDKLILRASDDIGKQAIIYKSEKRDEMVKEGCWILGNAGDQWSDLLGAAIAVRSFKLPNPMYYSYSVNRSVLSSGGKS